MGYLPKEGYRRILVMAAYGLLIVGLGYLFFRYLWKPLLPFLLAWGIAMAVRPAVNAICKRTRLPKKAVSFFVIIFVFLLILGLITVLCGRVAGELRGLSDDLMSDAAGAVGELFDFAAGAAERIPFLDRVEDPEAAEKIRQTVTSMIEGAVSRFSEKIPEMLMGMVAALPGIVIFTVVTVVATFYMGVDVTAVNGFIAHLLPTASRHYLFEAKAKLAEAGIKYVKAYLMLLLITFVQLLIGFFLLEIPYALTLAALIVLIDILPILGVGTVLVPWAVILLVRGDVYTGVGLFILFAVIWVVRQVAEPRIVGESIGLSPLLTLAVMYAGYHFMGFGGLFVFPLLAILLKNLFDIGVIRRPWRGGEKKS
ncbi:MAG: sporulation integral membrane protein YtvI [Clostridia bacterium]|nr:sporulation integral membrane protein YtvI [Clostridia bacterium]